MSIDWPPMKPASTEDLDTLAADAMSRFRVVLLTEDRTEIEPGSGYVRGGLPFPLQGDPSWTAKGGCFPASGKPIRYAALIDAGGKEYALVGVFPEVRISCEQVFIVKRECFFPGGN